MIPLRMKMTDTTGPSRALAKTRSALVAYGSETGNAQDCAREVQCMLARLHFTVQMCSLDEIHDLSVFNRNNLTIMVTSTAGQGQLPRNARSFFRRLLKRTLSETTLDECHFSTFGLGDASYPRYNWAARKLRKRMGQLGAATIHTHGEADEQADGGVDLSFASWLQGLRGAILQQWPLLDHLSVIPDDQRLVPPWELCAAPEKSHAKGSPEELDSHLESSDGQVLIPATLHENKRLTPQSHWQDVRQIILHSDQDIHYGPGDVLTIYPENADEDVYRLITIMGWERAADRYVQLSRTTQKNSNHDDNPPISAIAPMTLRSLIKRHIDLTAVPRRSFFAALAYFTSDEFQRARLYEFSHLDHLDELYDYTTRPRRSILEVLQEFDSVRVPWSAAFEVFPILRGRQFSIASGGQLKRIPSLDVDHTGTRFELLVAIVRYRTIIKKERQGVCTRYLAGLQPGNTLYVSLQRGGMVARQSDADRPVVMIAPGTGLAPMRSLIWERAAWVLDMLPTKRLVQMPEVLGLDVTATDQDDHSSAGERLGPMTLFFGCRSQGVDDFFHHEWTALAQHPYRKSYHCGTVGTDDIKQARQDKDRHMPLSVHTAYSRDQQQKVYVQDLMRQHGRAIYRHLLEEGGTIYVCGSSGTMPKAVRAALVDIFFEHGTRDNIADQIIPRDQMQPTVDNDISDNTTNGKKNGEKFTETATSMARTREMHASLLKNPSNAVKHAGTASREASDVWQSVHADSSSPETFGHTTNQDIQVAPLGIRSDKPDKSETLQGRPLKHHATPRNVSSSEAMSHGQGAASRSIKQAFESANAPTRSSNGPNDSNVNVIENGRDITVDNVRSAMLHEQRVHAEALVQQLETEGRYQQETW